MKKILHVSEGLRIECEAESLTDMADKVEAAMKDVRNNVKNGNIRTPADLETAIQNDPRLLKLLIEQGILEECEFEEEEVDLDDIY